MTNTQHFKDKLEEELKLVESELKTVGRINPENPGDWEPTPKKDWDALNADENEVADTIEEFEDNAGILKQLEIRYNEIKKALIKIKDGGYGVCEIGGEEIEEARLEANPAATTCMKHMK
jgi:RNA polymerase-binding transcription factor DksA